MEWNEKGALGPHRSGARAPIGSQAVGGVRKYTGPNTNIVNQAPFSVSNSPTLRGQRGQVNRNEFLGSY